MKLAYIRLSAADQNLGRQREKIEKLGIEDRFIFEDKASGKNFDRAEYVAMKRVIREGDTLYIDSLDRLGRDYDGIIAEWKTITREINADIIVLDQEALFDSRKFKTMGNIGKLMEDQFLSLLAYLAEEERKKIRQRQKEGIALTLKEHRPYGRPKIPITDDFKKAYDRWKTGEITAVKAMELSGYKKCTFYHRVEDYEASNKKK